MPLLDTKQAAEFLGLSPRTLESWRILGNGPRFLRLGRGKAVRYRTEDLEEFVRERLVQSTSEEVLL